MPRERPGQLGLRLARQYGLDNAQFAGDVIASATYRRRATGASEAQAHRVAQRMLAHELGVPERSVPTERGVAQSIGQYEKGRRRVLSYRRTAERFDADSIRFASENGVCPRCGKAGRFGEESGRCPCGFCYHDGSAHHLPVEIVPFSCVE